MYVHAGGEPGPQADDERGLLAAGAQVPLGHAGVHDRARAREGGAVGVDDDRHERAGNKGVRQVLRGDEPPADTVDLGLAREDRLRERHLPPDGQGGGTLEHDHREAGQEEQARHRGGELPTATHHYLRPVRHVRPSERP
jgi:hypothetical protein